MEFSLGLIEVQALGHAIFVLDAMTKAADVEFVATERRLGGRLVTLVIKGQVSAVTAAIEAGKEVANEFKCLKAAEVIARPHPEILKFLHLDIHGNIEPVSESAATHVGTVNARKTQSAGTIKSKENEKKATAQKSAVKKEETKKSVSKADKSASDKKAPSKKGTKK